MNGVARIYFAYYALKLMKYAETIFSRSNSVLSFGVLVLEDSNMLSLAACIDPLRAANRRAGRILFDWQLLSQNGGSITLTSGIDIATATLPARPEFDALILVAGFRLTELATPNLRGRLRLIAPRLKAMGGVDGGGWVLARSGLLDGHTATTHWEDLEEFSEVFPAVNVVRDRFTISGKYFTTGGASPAIDMMLHLIRARHGSGLAGAVASAFIYDSTQNPATPQGPVATNRLAKKSPKLAKAVEIMAGSLDEPPSISDIAHRVDLSPRALEGVFQRQIGQAPGSFFLSLRLQEARRLLLDTARPVQAVALATGFASQAVFARAFRREFGLSARELRRLKR
jgi:AraC family transcriptional regulator, glycine betaine-responsive activator